MTISPALNLPALTRSPTAIILYFPPSDMSYPPGIAIVVDGRIVSTRTVFPIGSYVVLIMVFFLGFQSASVTDPMAVLG